MRRIKFPVVTLLVVALTLVFASCTKDGIYKPKKKISKIYVTTVTEQESIKTLSETWTWDGNLLSKIDYGDDDIATFSYDKKQLTDISNGDTRIELTYDSKGKFVENFKVYYDNTLSATYTFQRGDHNLISGYTIEMNDDAYTANAVRLIENVFRFIAPEVAHSEAAEYAKAATCNLKGENDYSVTFTYDGKNIIEKAVKYDDVTTTYTYTYNEYLNPFYGLLLDVDNSISKNAVATCVMSRPSLPDYNYSYTYKADGKVPTQMTEIFTWTISAGSINSTHTETTVTDYEFVD